MSTSIKTNQRFTPKQRCPICSGHRQIAQGKGERCYGFLSDDGEWAHCTRSEHAGSLEMHDGSSTYAHRLKGDCKCGTRHDPSLASASQPGLLCIHWYLIHDEQGKLVAKHKRIDEASGAKQCIWYRADDSKGLGGRPLSTLPLYGVHLLKDRPDEPVIVVEGEKAADALIAAGRLAVGTVTGARVIPSPDVLRTLQGREIILWADNDDDGRAHMAGIAARLVSLGAQPQLVTWADAPPKGDAYDFILKCGSNGNLDLLIAEATPYESSASSPARRYLTEDEIEKLRPPTWLIRRVIPAGEVTMVSGAGDTGKTFIVTDMMKRVAQHYPVLYVAAEDAPGIRIRKRAWELHYQSPKNGKFMMWPEALDLFDTASVDSFIAEVLPLGLRMITIDTLSPCLGGADENSNTDMAIVMNNCDRVAHQTGAAVVVIHHTTKDGQAFRGASAMRNNTYAHLEVSRDDDLIQFKIGRIKNTPEQPSRYFKLVTVPLHDIIDDEGVPMSSAVILPADRVASGDRLTSNQIKMLEALLTITDAQGGAATTDLEKTTGLVGNSFYSALKRLRGLELVSKGEKRTDPLVITGAGRARLAVESNNPEHQSGGVAINAAPPFEVNENLDTLLPLLPGSNSLLPNEAGSNPQLLPNDLGSNVGSNEDEKTSSEHASYHVTTNGVGLSDAVATTATKLLPEPNGSNGSVTTTSLSPLGEGVGSNRSSSGLSHDQRRQAEVDKALGDNDVKAARKAAEKIQGHKAQLAAFQKIEEHEATYRAVLS